MTFACSELFICWQEEADVKGTLEAARQATLFACPEYTSRILVASKNRIIRVRNRPEFGKTSVWKDEPEFKFNVWVYSVLTSNLKDKGGRCSSSDENRTMNIAHDVLHSVEWTPKVEASSIDAAINEAESRLDKEGLHWLTIEVGEWGHDDSCVLARWSDSSNVCSFYSHRTLQRIDYGMPISVSK